MNIMQIANNVQLMQRTRQIIRKSDAIERKSRGELYWHPLFVSGPMGQASLHDFHFFINEALNSSLRSIQVTLCQLVWLAGDKERGALKVNVCKDQFLDLFPWDAHVKPSKKAKGVYLIFALNLP